MRDTTAANGTTSKSRLIPLGLGIGFYNGFFGPGTGAIWNISLQRFMRMPIQKATMVAKPLNLVGNVTALAIFFAAGQINFVAGLCMGLGSILGGVIGANFVMYKDAKWLHAIFNLLMGISVLGAFSSIR